ncbi:Dimer_Tnp_hAT domain-containing protein [Meloidogyne graminicola]|uniref:Dimer_Tnp_hAT domain-containing protein n=1 Tax=Meloidogyne graminicola TaxID=189291 RepID=A0A8S9ZTJ3_9BILA|nr:Dimer_Tnp_hAT domain-containing protein [Meloidogyne graminicola]
MFRFVLLTKHPCFKFFELFIYFSSLEMANNSKYSNYFLFEKTKISCLQEKCSYFYTPKNEYGFPTTALRKHLAAGQVTEYLNTPRFEGSSADFWNNPINGAKFPLLLPLVRKYHSAPMSSSECERVFSAAKYILDDRRKNLSTENLEMQLFLHENLLIYGFNVE